MEIKSVLLGTAFVLATSVGSVQAEVPFSTLADVPAVKMSSDQEVPFSTLADVPAVKMSSDQMEAVRGTVHVFNLLGRLGVTLTQLAASNATTASGSIGAVGNDRPTINALHN